MNETFIDFIECFISEDLDNPIILSIFGFFGMVLVFKAISSLVGSVTNIWK